VQLVGESAAVRGGDGILTTELSTLSVEAEATNIPQFVEVDISGLGVGDSIHAGDVKLPEDVTLLADANAVIAHVLAAATAEQLEAELASAEAEARGPEGVPAAAEAAVPEGDEAPAAGDTREAAAPAAE
ncbi:MAG: hypothetical protein LC640_11920, partial [Frankia sp.]|nr:hypothetical protein [Frankia sp.]